MPDTDTALHTKVWKKEDIDRAIAGDEVLKKKLESDLNVTLDGHPLDVISVDAVIEGIMIDSPVKIEVSINGTLKSLTGRIQEAYLPQFCAAVSSKLDEKFNPSPESIAGTYKEIADKIIAAQGFEHVAESLKTRTSEERLANLTVPLKKVLDNTVVLLNESYITSASYQTYDVAQNKTTNDISLGLTDDGRMRLWKYSHDHNGFYLLFVVDSIAIAAPKVTTELSESVTTIRRVPSKELVDDAVKLLNEIIKDKK